MKKIYTTLSVAVTLFAFVLGANAQAIDPTIIFPDESQPYTLDDSNIAYKKQISKPNDDGVYYIKLEAFVTGREVHQKVSLAADIVLVLDTSGSMSYGLTYKKGPNSVTGNMVNSGANPTSGTPLLNTYYWIKRGDNYYQIKRVRSSYYNNRYYLYYTDNNGENHYLNDSSSSNPTYNGNDIYIADVTRRQALIDAVKTFIDLIDTNDKENAPSPGARLGNRIAIVPFSGAVGTVTDFTPLGSNASSNTGVVTLKAAVDALPANGGTNAHLGMQEAAQLLAPGSSTSRLKTVVFFTDGDPGLYGDWSQDDDTYNTWTSANATIAAADVVKGYAVESEDPAQKVIANVFTVSVIPNPSDYTKVYLEKTSSNYLDATSMGRLNTWNASDIWSNGNADAYVNPKSLSGGGDIDFSLEASSAEGLKTAFETVASNTGGSSASLGSSSVAAVDVVSASFMLPEGAEEDGILVYTAKCIGENIGDPDDDDDNQLLFDTEILAPNRDEKYQPYKKVGKELVPDGDPVDVDDDINIQVGYPEGQTSGKKNVIKVDGFDYGNNWCGAEENQETHTTKYRGYKVIILIPIQMDPDAVGGVGVETNGPGSGISVDGEPQITFVSPKVSLPANIHIRKEGLEVGESAKFTIERAALPKNNVPAVIEYNTLTWTDVTSVFVTRHSGQDQNGVNAPITKVNGMPSEGKENGQDVIYIYRVVEETDWSWSYTSTPPTITTSDLLEVNPFIFKNKKKTNIEYEIRHAESKATNTFKSGNTEGAYDDSKSNGRTVIIVETETESEGGGTTTP